jgi:hypothetical protein
LLPAGRVHLYPPPQLVAPCCWIDQPTGTIVDGLAMAEFPVHLVADGNPDEQCRWLDTILSGCWSLLSGPYRPLEFTPGTVDAGVGRAEQLHEYVVNVEVLVDAITFCPPTPAAVPVWPAAVPA